jgi:hypothetical protein
MRRSLFILFALVLASGALCLGTYRLAGRLCTAHFARPTDDLDWLRLEFHLSDAEISRIRQLHQGYLPQCRQLCDRIAASKGELHQLLSSSPNAPAAIERKLTDIALLRAQCQAAMLRHFGEVSRAMPPEPGRRYLTEMQRLTLGFHEQVEHSMSGDTSSPHGRR